MLYYIILNKYSSRFNFQLLQLFHFLKHIKYFYNIQISNFLIFIFSSIFHNFFQISIFFTVFEIRNESSRYKFIQFSHYLEWISNSLYDPNHDPKRKHLWLKRAAQGMNHPWTKTVDPRLLSKEPRSEPRGAFTFQRCIYKDEIHFHSRFSRLSTIFAGEADYLVFFTKSRFP